MSVITYIKGLFQSAPADEKVVKSQYVVGYITNLDSYLDGPPRATIAGSLHPETFDFVVPVPPGVDARIYDLVCWRVEGVEERPDKYCSDADSAEIRAVIRAPEELAVLLDRPSLRDQLGRYLTPPGVALKEDVETLPPTFGSRKNFIITTRKAYLVYHIPKDAHPNVLRDACSELVLLNVTDEDLQSKL